MEIILKNFGDFEDLLWVFDAEVLQLNKFVGVMIDLLELSCKLVSVH